MEQSSMHLYLEQRFDAGIRLEGKDLPGDAIDLPKKRARITLMPNTSCKLYKDLMSLSGKWYDDIGSTYEVRIAVRKGYVTTSFVSRREKAEKALITVATDLEKIIWQNPYGEDPPTYELSIVDIDHVVWTRFKGRCPKCKQFKWMRIRD